MTVALVGIAFALLLNILGFSFWLGRLSSKVDSMANDTLHIKESVALMQDNMQELSSRISYIEGRLKERE